MDDTSSAARRVQYAALRRMSVAQELAAMNDLTMLVRGMAREGLKRRNPSATESELDDLFCELMHGTELAARVLAHKRGRSGRGAA